MTNAITMATGPQANSTQGKKNGGDYAIVAVDTTDERLIDMWLASGKRGNSPSTQALYRRVWNEFADFVSRPLQDIGLDTLQEWRSTLIGKPATQRVKIAAIRSLFAFAAKVGYLALNPALMVETPFVPENPQAHTVSVVELAKILDACETPLESALLRVLYSSGARISEVLALTWEHITPREDNRGAHLFIASGKGRKSRRVGVNAAAYNSLLALRVESTQRTDFVFRTKSGASMDRHACHRLVKRVIARAGVKDAAGASCHWMRHSHATHSLELGANVGDVKSQLGHASLNTTSLYVHSSAYSSDKLPL